MKPISLTFQAFGSYPGKVDIDFVRLWQHGVFTITGPNGAGKTTIFDAMVYALYNEIPGYRKVRDIRSHFAKTGTETFVEFTFEVDGQRWVIRRTPAQMRPVLRGQGETTQAPAVHLKRVDEAVGGITRASLVDTEVKRLIGLNAEQFQQVILIPQGKFEEVLKAPTSKRLEVLRQLFPVEIYQKFTDEVLRTLLTAADADYAEKKRGTAQVQEYIVKRFKDSIPLFHPGPLETTDDGENTSAAAQADKEPDLIDGAPSDLFERAAFEFNELHEETLALASVESAFSLLSHVRDVLSQERDAAGERAALLEQQLHTAEAQAKELGEHLALVAQSGGFADESRQDAEASARLDKAAQATAALPIVRQVQGAAKELENLDCELPSLERKAAGVVPDALQWPADVTASTLRALQNTTANVRASKSAACAEATRLTDAIAALEAAREESAAAKDGIEEWTTYLKAITDEDKALAAELRSVRPAERTLAALQEKIKVLQAELDQLEAAGDLTAEIKEAKAVLAAATATEAAAAAALERARVAEATNAAVHAASLLVNGEPCPTCGSCTHPAPARAAKSARVSDVKKLSAAYETARADVLTAQSALSTLEGKKSVDKGRSKTAVKNDIKSLREAEATLLERVARITEIEARREEISVDKTEANENLIGFKSQAAAAKTTLAGETVLKKQVSDFEQSHGTLDDFDFDVTQWEEFESALSLVIDAVEKRTEWANAHNAAVQLLAPVLVGLGVDDVASLLLLAMPEPELAAARADIQARAVNREVVLAKIAAYVEAGKPTELPETDGLRESANGARTHHNRLADRVTRLNVLIEAIVRSTTEFAEISEALEESRKKKQEITTLYNICSGKGGGGEAERIKLETWVLADYLRQVVDQANVRMELLFNGRFHMRVAEEAENQVGNHGLELEVFDAETGKYRSVRMLANGETFKCALALALGLSDVVAMGGSRRIDALFLDEGFGALDAQSREAVIHLFDRLQQTGRMVGLITHVTELQQALPLGISVNRGDVALGGGSSLEVHYPFG